LKRRLLRSTAFVRAARRAVKKNPQLARELPLALDRLSDNVFQPLLRSHKLEGPLAGRREPVDPKAFVARIRDLRPPGHEKPRFRRLLGPCAVSRRRSLRVPRRPCPPVLRPPGKSAKTSPTASGRRNPTPDAYDTDSRKGGRLQRRMKRGGTARLDVVRVLSRLEIAGRHRSASEDEGAGTTALKTRETRVGPQKSFATAVGEACAQSGRLNPRAERVRREKWLSTPVQESCAETSAFRCVNQWSFLATMLRLTTAPGPSSPAAWPETCSQNVDSAENIPAGGQGGPCPQSESAGHAHPPERTNRFPIGDGSP